MSFLTFDQEKRRKYQEPQTTKNELLRPPPNTDEETEWTIPRDGPGLNDFYANNSTWGFNEIGHGTTAARPSPRHVKEEYASQQSEAFGQKRAFEYGDTPEPNSKKAREDSRQASRAVSTASSDDRWGRKTGVIDLTLGEDSSDDEEPQVFPERQFVPRAEDDNNATLFSRHKSPSPPRTFTRGLSPIAAHPRQPPIIHRSKPPINPRSYKRTSVTPAAARQPHQIFNRATRSPALNNAQRSSTPSFMVSSVLPPEQAHGGSKNVTPSAVWKPTATVPTYSREKTIGPFVEEDDSDEDEPMAVDVGPNVPRDSLTRLIGRPRRDTPRRDNLAVALEESKRMREQALGRTQSGLATPAHTKSPTNVNTSGKPSAPEEDAVDASRDVPIPSIEFPPQNVAEKTQEPPVRSVQKESANNAQTRHFSTIEGRRAVPEEPRRRHQTITQFHLQTKNKDSHQSPRDHHQALTQRAQQDIKARNTTQLNGNRPNTTLSSQHEAQNKAAATVQRTHNESYHQNVGALRERIRLQNEKKNAQEERDRLQDAWEEREVAETQYRPPPQPDRRATLPDPSNARSAPPPQPAARPKPRPPHKKQPVSAFAQVSADAKKARERRERQHAALQAKNTQAEDDDSGAEAQREAEENHALAVPPSYQPLRPHKTQRSELDKELRAPTERAPVTAFNKTSHQLPEGYNDGDGEYSTNVETPEGPFAANSAAGVHAIRKSIQKPMNLPFDDDEIPQRTAAQRFMGTGSTKISLNKAAAKSKALYITPSDLQLYKWRQEKVTWSEILDRRAKLGLEGLYKSEDRMRKHFREISKAIEIEEISPELCEQVLQGDEQAQAELNRLAALHSVDAAVANGPPRPFQKIVKPDPGNVITPEVVAGPLAPPALAFAPPAPRPTQGGKVLDDAAYHALLADATEVWGAESDTEESREESPMRDEDCVQWQYVMQRRDFFPGALEECGYEQLQEDLDWEEYDRTFEQLGEANAEACRYIFTSRAGSAESPEFSYGTETWTLRQEKYENDMVILTLQAAELGIVQVRVARRLMTFKDFIIPSSKDGWISRTVYRVIVKEMRKSDGLFSEVEQIDHPVLESAVFGSADQANSVAIDEWLRLTLIHRSANLNQRELDRIQAKEQLQLELLDQGDRTVFSKKMDDEKKAVEVAVVECKYQGPRN